MKKVLLSGATGFIGRQCLAPLLAAGYEVHAVTSRATAQISPGVHWHYANLLDPHQIADVMTSVRPTHLLHLAWYAAPGTYRTAPENVHWVQASLELLRAFKLHGGQRVVMAGSCAEYDWNYGYCSEQLTPLSPATLYGTCKHALQTMLDGFGRQERLSSAWGRIFYLYGPCEDPRRLVAHVIRSLLRGEPARCSHGNRIGDFLHVEDVARAFIALLESPVTGPVNIASGCPVTIKRVIYEIAHQLDRPDLIHLNAIPAPPDEPRLLVANIGRLTDEVGWSPAYDFQTGLRNTIEWWRENLNRLE
jgi:nucleoside-diphosphate-sugar epimerase